MPWPGAPTPANGQARPRAGRWPEPLRGILWPASAAAQAGDRSASRPKQSARRLGPLKRGLVPGGSSLKKSFHWAVSTPVVGGVSSTDERFRPVPGVRAAADAGPSGRLWGASPATPPEVASAADSGQGSARPRRSGRGRAGGDPRQRSSLTQEPLPSSREAGPHARPHFRVGLLFTG
jgi:hypothetical protein